MREGQRTVRRGGVIDSGFEKRSIVMAVMLAAQQMLHLDHHRGTRRDAEGLPTRLADL